MSSRSFAILALLLGLFTGAWAAEPISGTQETSQSKPLKKIIIPVYKALGQGTKARINLIFEMVSGPMSSSQCERINEQFARQIIGNYAEYFQPGEPLPDILYTVKDAANYIANDYESLFTSLKAEDENFGTEGPIGIMMLGRICDYPKGFLSYRLQDSFALGDYHGRPAYYERGLVLNKETGEPVKLDDIIAPDSHQELGRILAQAFHGVCPDSQMDYETIPPSNNFVFDTHGVTFIYDTGTLESYAVGPIILTIPWDDFKTVASLPLL